MVVADRLTDELKNRHAGKTEVRDARVRVQDDSSGEPALYIVLTLANPSRGQPTWPTDDLWALRREVRAIKNRVEDELEDTIDLPWFVVFEPERPSELEDEGLHEIVTLDDE